MSFDEKDRNVNIFRDGLDNVFKTIIMCNVSQTFDVCENHERKGDYQ